MMKLITIVVPLKNIGVDGEFRLFKNRVYYWREKYQAEHEVTSKKGQTPKIPDKRPQDPLKEGLPTVIGWKKKMGALYDWDDPFPQVWVPGGSLHSMTNPAMLDSLGSAKDFRMMLEADSMTKLMRISLMLSVIAMIAVFALAYAVYAQTTSIDHFSRVVGNLTGSGIH